MNNNPEKELPMKKTKNIPANLLVLAFMISIMFTGCKKENDPDIIKDADGNVYNAITIGTQMWIKENLKTTKYSNGDPILNVSETAAWAALSTGAYCDYENNGGNSSLYGHLYNWYAVKDARKICPAGWHVPGNDEWNVLASSLGGSTIAGGKLKEEGTAHWTNPNTQASNSSGFTALPAGYRYANGNFFDLNEIVFFWTSYGSNANNGYAWALYYNDEAADDLSNNDARNGYSVRCIKD